MIGDGAGKVDVSIQDQTTTPIDYFFSQIKGAPTTVAVETAIDDKTVTVASAAGCSIGDYFGCFNADDQEDNRVFFATILDIDGNDLSLDTPLDFDFKVGDTAACFTRDLGVNGSVTTQIFSIQVGSNATQSIDINRIMISMVTDNAVSLAKFGDLPKLTNGLVLRRVNGFTNNIFNVKDNGEIANLCFDYDPYTTANLQQGQHGAKFRYTFNGQDKHGVAIRLNPGDSLELLVQDDLRLLGELGTTAQFRVVGEGHFVDEPKQSV
jgi:hypothetical protein